MGTVRFGGVRESAADCTVKRQGDRNPCHLGVPVVSAALPRQTSRREKTSTPGQINARYLISPSKQKPLPTTCEVNHAQWQAPIHLFSSSLFVLSQTNPLRHTPYHPGYRATRRAARALPGPVALSTCDCDSYSSLCAHLKGQVR